MKRNNHLILGFLAAVVIHAAVFFAARPVFRQEFRFRETQSALEVRIVQREIETEPLPEEAPDIDKKESPPEAEPEIKPEEPLPPESALQPIPDPQSDSEPEPEPELELTAEPEPEAIVDTTPEPFSADSGMEEEANNAADSLETADQPGNPVEIEKDEVVDDVLPEEQSDVRQGVVMDAVAIETRNDPPVYPGPAEKRGWEGTVWLDVLVETSGKVRDVKVIHSSGYGILDRAAVKAVKEWVFQPATYLGRPVARYHEIPFHFKLP